jgi:transposase
MHLVTKQVTGCEYYYLVEKERRGKRVFTSRTIYIGNKKKLAELIEKSVSAALPESFTSQSVGATLALTEVAEDLEIEKLIDSVCPVRQGAAPVGSRLLMAAIHRALAPRGQNGISNLQAWYEDSFLSERYPDLAQALDDRRMGEMLGKLTTKQVDQIEAAVVERLVESEGVSMTALAFDCTNFDSYASARSKSRLLQRGHGKSGKSLRVLGLGLLASDDDGMPLLTFAYPGNLNDVTAFKRFLRALDQRRAALKLPLEATIAADGGNISKQLLLRLERDPRYYVMRLPPHHLKELVRFKTSELEPLSGRFKGKAWAKKHQCSVYGVERCVVDVYSKRMHERQMPGLLRDQDLARRDLKKLQELLERQRKGLRHQKPLTVRSVERRVEKALAREHMDSLFEVEVTKGDVAPELKFVESEQALKDIEERVLGRTLLVTNRADWAPEQIVLASRIQSRNENLFRDLKDPGGPSMVPLRHRRDKTLRAHALVVVVGLILAKVVQRRVKKAGVEVASLASVLGPLKEVERARVQFGKDAPPALRALALTAWVPSARNPRQTELLKALNLLENPDLGTTLASHFGPKRRRNQKNTAA